MPNGNWNRDNRQANLDSFQFYLEENLYCLHEDLVRGRYRHGHYHRFVVTDSKRREISVASIRDRVVHRLLYDYLVRIYDQTFIYDAWSCRKDKGVIGAINRVQDYIRGHPRDFVWRMDITKFFDSVQHDTLLTILERRLNRDSLALALAQEVIRSYPEKIPERERERVRGSFRSIGLPIGNLTSQIFANIYLNEFDRFVVHVLKPERYVRYGDDCLLFVNNRERAGKMRVDAIIFLQK